MDYPVKTILIHLLFCLHSTKFASLHENPFIYCNLRLFSDILHLLILRVSRLKTSSHAVCIL